jgi:hypothetical protein
VHHDAVLTDDHSIDWSVVDVPEAIRIALLEEGKHLLDQEAAVGAALAIRKNGHVPVFARLQEVSDPSLRDERVQAVQLGGDRRGELGLV